MYLREIIYIGGWGFLAFFFSRVLHLNVGCLSVSALLVSLVFVVGGWWGWGGGGAVGLYISQDSSSSSTVS